MEGRPKWRGQRAREVGAGAPAVLRAGRVPQGLLGQAPAAAPVAGDPAERGEAGGAAVGAHAHAVDARAAHHGDPARFGDARAQDREGVVADLDGRAPRARVQRGRQLLLLDGEVGVGQAGRDVVDRA